MEKEIEQKLNKIYNIDVEIKFLSYGLYEGFLRIGEKFVSIIFALDFKMPIESNIRNIVYKFDNEILALYKN